MISDKELYFRFMTQTQKLQFSTKNTPEKDEESKSHTESLKEESEKVVSGEQV